ncbi:MAG: hypothetical protein H0U50_07225 [Pyrinomonadaceae bacterium]|nr:hypothetical protein [Pyrinomonadaceae bacterium]
MANWRENLEKLRSWIDDEQPDKIAENVIKAGQNKSASEVFLQKLLNSVKVAEFGRGIAQTGNRSDSEYE